MRLMPTIAEDIEILREAVRREYGGKSDAESQHVLVMATAGLNLLEGFLKDIRAIASNSDSG